MLGKCSTFGGPQDKGMLPRPGMPDGDTGLAFYEKLEADKRPDLFTPAPANEPQQATWKRLRNWSSFYIALPLHINSDRKLVQSVPYKISNPKTGLWAPSWVVDRGPAAHTGRILDCSDFLLKYLGLTTDDDILVEPYA